MRKKTKKPWMERVSLLAEAEMGSGGYSITCRSDGYPCMLYRYNDAEKDENLAYYNSLTPEQKQDHNEAIANGDF